MIKKIINKIKKCFTSIENTIASFIKRTISTLCSLFTTLIGSAFVSVMGIWIYLLLALKAMWVSSMVHIIWAIPVILITLPFVGGFVILGLIIIAYGFKLLFSSFVSPVDKIYDNSSL